MTIDEILKSGTSNLKDQYVILKKHLDNVYFVSDGLKGLYGLSFLNKHEIKFDNNIGVFTYEQIINLFKYYGVMICTRLQDLNTYIKRYDFVAFNLEDFLLLKLQSDFVI